MLTSSPRYGTGTPKGVLINQFPFPILPIDPSMETIPPHLGEGPRVARGWGRVTPGNKKHYSTLLKTAIF